MIQKHIEKRLLQSAICLACLVPISAGIYGILKGAEHAATDIDSHFRYLSGLLLAIGFCFSSAIPNIEFHNKRMFLLTAIVVTGGIGRLAGVVLTGAQSPVIYFALIMELIITPLICLWQLSFAKRF